MSGRQIGRGRGDDADPLGGGRELQGAAAGAPAWFAWLAGDATWSYLAALVESLTERERELLRLLG